MNAKILLALLAISVATLPLFESGTSSSIIISAIPVSQLIHHEISLLDTAQNTMGKNNDINETETDLNNGIAFLSKANSQIVPILLFTLFVLGVIGFYGRYLKDRRFTSNLGDATGIAIGVCFGIMILFYTAADITSLAIDQTTAETLTLVSNDQKHADQLQFFGSFILEKIADYRIDIESSIFFGLMTLGVVVCFIWNKIKPESIFPHVIFYLIISTIILWTIEYFLNIYPQSPTFISCLKVHC